MVEINPCKAIGCSLCCGNIGMQLSGREANFLKKKGANLTEIYPWDLFDRPDKWYRLTGKCPLNKNGDCQVHGTPDQPECCKGYGMNGQKCQNLRREAGLPNSFG